MHFNSNQEVEHLVRQFETCTLPEVLWTHQAHLVVGLYHLHRFSFETALEQVRTKIIAYNESTETGNTGTRGYHETMTVFWMRTLEAYRELNRGLQLYEMCNKIKSGLCADDEFPMRFFSRELLFSSESRRRWMEPDVVNMRALGSVLCSKQ